MTRIELTAERAPGLLEASGVVSALAVSSVSPLGGGVSSVVLRASTPSGSLVLKQPRARFDVLTDWQVDTYRFHVEASVGRWLHARLGPGAARVARVRGISHENELLVVDAAPQGWTSWKEELLSGTVGEARAETIGRLLRRIHSLAGHLAPGEFQNDRLFHQQRIAPYWRHAAQQAPEVRKPLAELESMFFQRQDFVHGDFSPKNLLVGNNARAVWLIDHEVATRGDAAFDIGFLWTHLTLKVFHNPKSTRDLMSAGAAFARGYGLERDPTDPDRESRAMRYLGGLLLARVVGKSRAEYLDEHAANQTKELAVRLLKKPLSSWQELPAGEPN